MPCELCCTDYDEVDRPQDDCNCLEAVHEKLRYGGETMENQLNLKDYSTGASVKLSVLDNKPSFTITSVERSDYEENLGIRITTRESFDGANQFHTTRIAIVSKFYSKEGTPTALTTAILAGGELKVKIGKITFKNGKEGFALEQA